MGVDAPASDDVTARFGDIRRSAAREQRPGEKDRCADSFRELRVGSRGDVALGMDTHNILLAAFDTGAELLDDLQHHAHVLDIRQVVQCDRLIGQQAGGEDRQRGILVAAGTDRSLEPPSPFDREALHGHGGAIVLRGRVD